MFGRWFDQERFAEMEFDGNDLVVYDRNSQACNNALVAHVCQWKALEKTCGGISLRSWYEKVPFVRYSGEVKFVCSVSY